MALRFLADWLLLPPSGPLVLALVGLLLHRWRVGKMLLVVGLGLLYAFSLPLVGFALMAPLQQGYEPVQIGDLDGVGAIVVLGAGYRSGATEFSGETVSDLSLVRLRYAAHLHRQTLLPVLATGGGPEDRLPEAHWMAQALDEYGVQRVIRESDARDTWENALKSAALLEEEGISRIALVTHAFHMPRAQWAFEQAGVDLVPAATGAYVPRDSGFSLGALRPQATAMCMSWLATHEYLGILWYRWRHRTTQPTPAP